MHDENCELRTAIDDRNDGVFATRAFAAGDTVMLGVVGRPAPANHSHANQVSLTAWVFEDGLGPKVNHYGELVAPYLRAADRVRAADATFAAI